VHPRPFSSPDSDDPLDGVSSMTNLTRQRAPIPNQP
jgi:hypothetical protein